MLYFLIRKNVKYMTIEVLPESPDFHKMTFSVVSILMIYLGVVALILTLEALVEVFLMVSFREDIQMVIKEKIFGQRWLYRYKRLLQVVTKRYGLAIIGYALCVVDQVPPLEQSHVSVKPVTVRAI